MSSSSSLSLISSHLLKKTVPFPKSFPHTLKFPNHISVTGHRVAHDPPEPDIRPGVIRTVPDSNTIPPEKPTGPPPTSPSPNPESPGPPTELPTPPDAPPPPPWLPGPEGPPEVVPPHGPEIIPPKPPEVGPPPPKSPNDPRPIMPGWWTPRKGPVALNH